MGVLHVLLDLLGQVEIVALLLEHAGHHQALGLGEVEVAGGDMQQIGLAVHQLGKLHALLQGVAALHVLGAAEAHLDEEVLAAVLADAVDDHEQQAGPVLQAAAEAVGAVVGQRGEELVDEPAVAGVDHGHLETAGLGLLGGAAEGVHHGLDHLLGHEEHLALAVDRLIGGGLVGQGGDGLGLVKVDVVRAPGLDARAGPQHAGVVELNAGNGAVAVDLVGNAGQEGQVILMSRHDLGGGQLAGVLAGGIDNTVAQGDHGGTAHGPHAEELHIPLGGVALRGGIQVEHGDGRDLNAVFQGDSPDGQRGKYVLICSVHTIRTPSE